MSRRERIRIVSLIPSLHFGGDENRLLTFGSTMDRERFDHRVLILRPPTAEMNAQRGDLRGAYAEKKVEIHIVRTKGDADLGASNGSPLRKLRLIRNVAHLLRESRADIVDARMNYAIGIGVAAAKLARVPITVGTTYRRHTLSGPVKYPLGQASILALDALVSDSQYTIDSYQNWLLRPHAQAHVIPNGIAVPKTRKTRLDMLNHFGIPTAPNPMIIGQISRLMPFKGQEILVRAAADALRARPDLYLLLAGHGTDPAYPEHLLGVVSELGISEKVRIRGYPGPIGDVWSIIDIHAHPSLQDSSPIAIHESMALGLPAVVSDVAGIPDLVEDEKSGLVVPKGDVHACRVGLTRLLDDETLRRRLGEGANVRYFRSHTPEVMTDRIEHLFEALLANKRPLPA
jgi:glycosyltransferase involved in cell wall biosynthesis